MTTRISLPYKNVVAAFVLSVSFIFSQSSAFAAETTTVAVKQADVSSAEYKSFLQQKYNVNLAGTITQGKLINTIATILKLKPTDQAVTFSHVRSNDALYPAAAALVQQGILTDLDIQADQTVTQLDAISLAVRAAGLKELAYTYPTDKVNKVLSRIQVTATRNGLSAKTAQELATAIDTGLLPGEYLSNLKLSSPADESLLDVLLGKVLTTHGLYKHYIGYTSDEDIYTKLYSAYQTSDVIHAPELQTLVNTALEQGSITGYSLKDSRFQPNFIDALSLTYGHSDIQHAVQLIGLLRSEGLNAKVQFEPKTSAFIHLAEWGDPGPNVIKIKNGNYINYAKEFDLGFEFATAQDKASFQQVISAYAKKDTKDETGLIAGSWWQPLYFSLTGLSNYEGITNVFISSPDSPYTVNLFTLNEDADKVVSQLKAIDPTAVIAPYPFWVDKPFFNYLHGEAL